MAGRDTSPRQSNTRILVVDDHPVVREGLSWRISKQPEMEVCGEAEDSTEAMRLVEDLEPDVVIVDLSLKTGDGIDLIKQIRSLTRRPRVIVHTMYDESLYASRALDAGAVGYINKREAPDKLIEAIRQVMSGKIFLSPEMMQRVLAQRLTSTDDEGVSPIDKLSNRELEIFRLIGEGSSTGQIARSLHLSVHTVDSHRENIKYKLRLKTATELTRYAVQWVLKNC
jgi:DNA-binding NarL/FixJ family response regulator